MDKYILQDHLPKASTEDSSVTILSISGIDNKAYEGPPSVCHQHLHSNTYETEYPIELPGQRSIHGDVEKDGLSGGCRISLDAAPVSKGCQDTLKLQKDLADGQKQLEITCQVLAALLISLVHLGIGTTYGFSGVMLPELTDRGTSDLFLDESQAAFFSSLSDLGGFFGSVLSMALLMRLGHRVLLLLGLPISACAWLGLAFAQTPTMLQTMRFIVGLTGSFTLPAGNMYILEVSHKTLRGLLFGLVTTSRQAGVLFVYAIGSLGLGWRTTALICSGVAILPVVGLLFLPNSPRWLITQGLFTEAQKSLTFYRGALYDSEPEMNAIMDQVGENGPEKNSIRAQLRIMTEPSTLKTLLLLLFISLLYNFSGYNVLIAYIVPILQSASIDMDAYVSAMLIGAVRVAGTVIHLTVVDRMGRKPLLVSSYVSCALCIACLGGYFYFQSISGYVNYFGWVPLTSLVIFVLFTGVGQPVIFILQGELLPTSFRATGVSLILCLVFLGSFTAIRTYSLASAFMGEHGTFWLYGGVCFVIALVSAVSLPETRGRSLEEITQRK
ncbi:facilitated trehalose transporter Tret1-2 homolog [Penaeus monodon]|uniref:facilitated trehalose transporter Tret1-2 homolog n=1 Tax=Penaeus monodon TaxID=6687 RepID=UPI0018A79743|nr:facilitated trehalose transporter Tret1-2 homolog [Penaeus monodon]